MPEMSDDLNRISARNHRPNSEISAKKEARSAKKESTGKTGLTLPEDKVEIAGKRSDATATAGADKVEVRPTDLKRYTKMLMDMPDVRDDEVERVQQILAEDGYDESAISVVVDRLMDEI